MDQETNEVSRPRHIVIGEGLAPPPMILIGGGSRAERYVKWLNKTFDNASESPANTRGRNFLKACCQLAIMSKESDTVWTFKARQGRPDGTDLENTLRKFIDSKEETLRHTAAYIGITWPKE